MTLRHDPKRVIVASDDDGISAVVALNLSESTASEDVLKEDIEAYVEETDPGDLEAQAAIENWRATVDECPPETFETEEEAEPIAVYDALDEISAELASSLLETNGIETMTISSIVTMVDTTSNMTEGIWGRILVHRKDFDAAKEILRADIVADPGAGDPSENASD